MQNRIKQMHNECKKWYRCGRGIIKYVAILKVSSYEICINAFQLNSRNRNLNMPRNTHISLASMHLANRKIHNEES